ncbi:MAG: MBL fold metallo-hydrolase [Gammaproteobacteria bacterium]|nr:MBL fold metallo-hydrolase [Gammaproteobacteria bacterium]
MTKNIRFFSLIMMLSATLLMPSVHAQDQRAITQIAGDLYRFQNNFHYSVFLVTPKGVIATDPITAEAAAWLKAEIKKRFDLPIKFLIYSHDHADHIAGGEVFDDDETIVIAHRNAKETIIGEKRPTAVPEVTFSDRLTIELGGKHVELFYVGLSHSDNMIVMRFPEQRTLYAVDFVSVKRLPYRDLSDAYFPQWIEAIRLVETLDFDILAPGHGALGSKPDVIEHRKYLEQLYEAVLASAREGLSLDQMKTRITLPDFQHLGQYQEWLPLNIEGMYRQVQLHRRAN